MKSYRELDLTHFYFSIHFACFCKTNKTLEVTLKQNFVSSSDFIGFERNPMKSYRELDNAVLLLDTFCLFFQNKQNTRSDTEAKLCQFEWWRGDSRGIVSRTRQAPSYFSIQFSIENHSKWHWQNTLSVRASLPRNAGRWWRGDSHGIVSRTRQRRLTSRYNFLSKITRSDRARTRQIQFINL